MQGLPGPTGETGEPGPAGEPVTLIFHILIIFNRYSSLAIKSHTFSDF